ncbi:hypothetical protein C8J57DRAFT_1539022 [Mycena rebaudengoi]|nr:hypothetical protein C8J57DRAFT_1539022 [Mycena rebaudengoi]
MVRLVGPKGQRKAVEEQKREEKITEAVTLVNAGKASYDIAAQKFGLPRSTVYHRHHALFNGRLPEIIPDESDDDPSDKENASPVTGAKRKAQEADSDFYPSGRPKRRAVGPYRLCLSQKIAFQIVCNACPHSS